MSTALTIRPNVAEEKTEWLPFAPSRIEANAAVSSTALAFSPNVAEETEWLPFVPSRIAANAAVSSLRSYAQRPQLKAPSPNLDRLSLTGSELNRDVVVRTRDEPESRLEVPAKILIRPETTAQQSSFSALQEWEGYVVAMDGESFVANLVDLTARSTHPDQQVSIPLEELSDHDRNRLAPGQIFRWAIGYQRTRVGTKTRVSQIIFRDLPRWTETDRRVAEAQAHLIEELLDQENGSPNAVRARP